MNAVGRLGSYISRGVYTVSGPFHPFGGCVDVIVVEQPDGTFKSSPWYVRFGKFQGVLKTREKVVNICVNGLEADLLMYLDHKGEAYFLREVDEVEEGESAMMTNNSSSGDEESERPLRSQSCNFDDDGGGGGGKVVVARTNSRRAQFLGLVFGRRTRKESDFGAETDMRRADSLERAEFAANLLEVKWSTNIDTTKPMVKDSGSELFRDSSDRDIMRIDGSLVESKEVLSANNGDVYTMSGNELESSSDGVLSGTVPAVLQICPRKDSDDDEEEAFDTRGIEQVSEFSVSGEVETDKVQSLIYCEASESSIVRKDASREQTRETVYISTGESGELCVHAEVLRATTEPLSEDTVVQHLMEDYELEVPRAVGLGDSLTNCSDPGNYNEVADEPLGKPETCTQTNTTNPDPGFGNEYESQDMCTISSFNNSSFRAEEEENTAKICVPTEDTNIPPPSDDLEEEQLLFGEIDELDIGKIQSVESISPLNEDTDMSDQSQSPPEKFAHECQSPDFESSTGNFRISSSPIAITGAQNVVVDEDIGRLTESLPNLWSKIDSLVADDDDDDVNCLSHSLDSNSKVLNWTLQNKESPRSATLDGDEEPKLVPELSDVKDAEEASGVEHLPSTSAIEISLCKHLLYEGMGSDAASRAFDTEKLDLEKFTSLGPEVMKDNRLVVRINGSYFPWDAAAPMVLGAVSFGPAHIVELKGKIAVDQVERTVSGGLSSNANMSPGGNWKLWPFSFRRSPSRKAVQPVVSDVRNSDPKTASMVNFGVTEDNNTVRPKVVKKTVRSLCPTSEQLASLNLKGGRNTVTFTFLTPMLGKQQVDARIYLWKWNTRIVISDVDGTITRSDVLGQFMPLVGVDWSHLGVAHLFSAIKENGYQMLFLSARAISQAYITRQFLFNLKQDGKALPDGPVVISPDGLFPSLYREVIRRAPHEFKIACLEEIRSLFPSDCNPFYAGFGNRDTDEVSYLKVGIPKGKIFIINPKGEVAVNRRVDTKSYKSIHALVNGMFPLTASSEQEDFNSWNFWKLPPPDINE